MSTAPEEAFPLTWPVGWPRARRAEQARFGVWTLYKARSFLQHELRLLGATGVVLSSNIPLRQDGLPYSNVTEPRDHGVAVYFRIKGEPRVLAADRWDKCSHNFVALAKHVEAMRGQLRWGVGTLEQAFGGYKALPAMGASKPWWEILGVEPTAKLPDVEAKRMSLLRRHHPDVGGNPNQAAEINAAYDQARKELSP
jgi:hypothetical protein